MLSLYSAPLSSLGWSIRIDHEQVRMHHCASSISLVRPWELVDRVRDLVSVAGAIDSVLPLEFFPALWGELPKELKGRRGWWWTTGARAQARATVTKSNPS